VDEAVLAPLRARYGEPAVLRWEGEISEFEWSVMARSPQRRHDVTFFVFEPGGRLALIAKPLYPDGMWRPPGGGVKADEDFVAGATREAYEELGVEIELERYLVRTEARFVHGDDAVEWATHVFAARTDAVELSPIDTEEIAAARWGTTEELAGPLRERMLAENRAFWRYRVALHDAALAALAVKR
jgi:ADP-ribose pyrophosphatase YjhB (NUDIX family)